MSKVYDSNTDSSNNTDDSRTDKSDNIDSAYSEGIFFSLNQTLLQMKRY